MPGEGWLLAWAGVVPGGGGGAGGAAAFPCDPGGGGGPVGRLREKSVLREARKGRRGRPCRGRSGKFRGWVWEGHRQRFAGVLRKVRVVPLGAPSPAPPQKGDTPLHIAIRGRSRKLAELLLRNPKDGRLLYRPNKAGETPYNIDCSHQKSILTQIFGASECRVGPGAAFDNEVPWKTQRPAAGAAAPSWRGSGWGRCYFAGTNAPPGEALLHGSASLSRACRLLRQRET